MLIPSLPVNILTGAASQFIGAVGSRAASALGGFESKLNSNLSSGLDSSLGSSLDSGNIAGAQSFLSTLQQKLSQTGSSPAISNGIAQIGSDLKSGNIAAAKTDFASLRQTLEQLGQTQGATGAGDAASTSMAAMNLLQQSAYSAAINLSMPAGASSLSVNM
jgi:hypothetical protein